MPAEGEFLVVEGCGGLLVPLTAESDLRNFLWELGLPVLLVTRARLGTLNHTALTTEALRAAGLRIAATVVNFAPGDDRAFTDGLQHGGKYFEFAAVDRPGDVEALADAADQGFSWVDDFAASVALESRADEARAGDSLPRLADADRRVLWHPFTQMKDWGSREPVVIERADGPWLYDTNGRRYLDAISSLWTNVHGHRAPEIDDAIRRQLGKVAHSTLLGLANVPSIECAEELLKVAPKNLARVFYSDSGSTAVEVALKMAFQRAAQVGEPKRKLFVRFDGAYHGDTIGSVSVGGIELFHRIFGSMLFQSIGVPAPYAYRRPDGVSEADYAAASLAAFENVMRDRGDEIAAVVVEPVMQGAAGMIPQPKGWLPRVAAATKAAGALLICDEVATGFGRTGKMFAVEHEGIEPDLMCVAKGLTGGYLPLAATLTTEDVFEAFLGEPHENKTFFHGHTYTGNPLACAAAVANLRKMADDDTVQLGADAAATLAALLDDRIAPLPHVGDIRRRGLMVGIELVKDRVTKAAFDVRERIGFKVCAAAMDRGLRIRPLGDVIVLMPPLTIGDDELHFLTETLRAAILDVLPETKPR
jgi:adenosylmethionine-8-amino-7-oxononanoate aminotransferase